MQVFHMTNLQMLLIVASITLLIFSLNVYKKKKIWLFTFLFFFCGALFVGIFSLRVEWLDAIGISFGLNRGADLIVYISIMVLLYFVLSLYSKQSQTTLKQTDLIRKFSIAQSDKKTLSSSIVFVIPAYNESDHCIQVVQSVLDQGYGVVFVDDGSSNGLFARMKEAFSGAENIVLIQHFLNLGQGAALQTGFEYLMSYAPDTQFVVTFDSDGQHDLKDLSGFLDAFEQDPSLDVALGSRFLGTAINMPFSKKIVLKIWILFTSLFSGMWLTDTHNGYRVIKFSALPQLRLTFNGMEHASEILELIGQHKLHYKEVPNTIFYTEYSMARGQKLSNSIKIVKNLVMSKFFGS